MTFLPPRYLRTAKHTPLSCYCVPVFRPTSRTFEYPIPPTTSNLIPIVLPPRQIAKSPNPTSTSPPHSGCWYTRRPSTRFVCPFRVLISLSPFLSPVSRLSLIILLGLFHPCQIFPSSPPVNRSVCPCPLSPLVARSQLRALPRCCPIHTHLSNYLRTVELYFRCACRMEYEISTVNE